jgi:membrane associated rhomboid family serine protease
MTLLALIGINVLVSLAGFRALHPERPQDTRRAESFLFIPAQVARGENGLGMLLAHFAHAGFGHLLFNMIALYSFGAPVLAALGPARFLLIYVVAGLGSDLVVFALHKEDPTYKCLGASGSVFGILMAAVVLDPTTSVVMFFVPIPIPGPVFMLGYVVIAVFLILRKHRGSVSHEGHLGGAIIGLAVTGLLAPRGLGPLVRWLSQWMT